MTVTVTQLRDRTVTLNWQKSGRSAGRSSRRTSKSLVRNATYTNYPFSWRSVSRCSTAWHNTMDSVFLAIKSSSNSICRRLRASCVTIVHWQSLRNQPILQ
jgi:hypothetical protein